MSAGRVYRDTADERLNGDYRPAELDRVVAALEGLRLLAYPRVGGSLMSAPTRRNGSIEGGGDLDPGGRFWRLALKRTLADLDRIAKRVERTISGDDDKAGRIKCPNCRVGQRPQAKVCDQCGERLKALE